MNGIGEWGGGCSTVVDLDGRILQEVGTSQTLMTEMLDLDHTTRTREFGTLGLGQTFKQLRDSGHSFPIYENGKLAEGSFKELGSLAFHRNLNNSHPHG